VWGRVKRMLSGAVAYAPAVLSITSTVDRFVILSPGRCGSELLVELLRCQPGVVCEGEILDESVRMPAMLMEARAQRARLAGARFYGCKVLVGQLADPENVRFRDQPVRRLDSRGWAIVGLTRRNVLRQSISWLRAVKHGEYHRRGRDNSSATRDGLVVDVDELVAMMYMHEHANERIDDVVASARRSLHLVYEDDLEKSHRRQATVESVMNLLGGASSAASTDLVRTGGEPLSRLVTNFDELAMAVGRTKFAPLLDGEC
jgi:hypothetical protein